MSVIFSGKVALSSSFFLADRGGAHNHINSSSKIFPCNTTEDAGSLGDKPEPNQISLLHQLWRWYTCKDLYSRRICQDSREGQFRVKFCAGFFLFHDLQSPCNSTLAHRYATDKHVCEKPFSSVGARARDREREIYIYIHMTIERAHQKGSCKNTLLRKTTRWFSRVLWRRVLRGCPVMDFRENGSWNGFRQGL